jgi:arylsulfatase A-like enzyme
MNLSTPFREALPDILTLPEYFREHGFYTARVGKIFHQGVPSDIGRSGPDDPQSWDLALNPRGRDRDAEAGRLKNNTPGIPYGSAMTWLDDDGEDSEQTDGKVANTAIELLRANKDRPFFLAVGFYRPHVPLVAPKQYFAPYPLEQMRLAEETAETLLAVPSYTKAWEPNNFGMSPAAQREMIRAYSASTSFVDAQVGRVLDELNRLGLADNTVVVFTSDHGYLLGEHGQWMKNVLWEDSNRVPLIIRAPGVGREGARSPRTVELLDLYPTLTDLAGLPHYSRNEGVSLRPLLRRPGADWDRPAYSQVRGGRSVRTKRWRYTEWEGGHLGAELYDHRSDPGEHRNEAGNPKFASVVARMKALLPREAVEPRPQPGRYDTIRKCLAGYAGASQNNARQTGEPLSRGSAGQGGAALTACETLDP